YDVAEHGRERIVPKLALVTLPEPCPLEHFRAALHIEIANAIDAEPEGHQRGDDRARAGAGDVVKVVGKHELAASARDSQRLLDLREDFDRDDPADAAAVAGEQFMRGGAMDFRQITHG